MTDNVWSGRFGADPFETPDEPEQGDYLAWRFSSKGLVRDLKLVPAPESGEPLRFEPYLQAISMELNPDETELCLMFHTTGQMVFLKGRGLRELAEMVSEKRVASIHVWTEANGPAPAKVVTSMTCDKSLSD